MKEIIETIKIHLPESSVRISKTLEELLEEIEFVVESFISVGYLPDELDEIYKELQNIIEEMQKGYGQLNLFDDIEYEPIDEDNKPNYEDYIVDYTIKHTLLENFTHIKPYGFIFIDKEVKAKNWKELYVKASEMFFKIDRDIFSTFINKTYMNGKTKDYFSEEKANVDRPVKISEKLYISTDLGANDFRDLLIKIIKEYNYDVKEFKVFFRADYNPLHRAKYY